MTASINALDHLVSVSPQLCSADLTSLSAMGFAVVVNNRPDGEDPGQPEASTIESAARAVGVDYVALPVTGMPNEATVGAFAALLDRRVRVLAFCRSGTRSTILWALAEARRGTPHQDIRAAALSAGYDLSRLPL